jgi:hypothetical protein
VRVLAVVPLYPPRSRVGAWLSTHECLAYLVGRGHHVDVVTQLAAEDRYELDGVHVFGRRAPTQELAAACDVMISHLGDRQEGARFAQQAGRPSVRMVHGQTTQALSLLREHPPALVVHNSAATAAEVAWPGPQLVVRPPVYAERYATTPGDHVTLVNLSLAKGGGLFDLLARALPELRFLGVRGGYGPQVGRILPNVEHVGTTQNIRDDVYARTRVLLMPSAVESYGRVGVEAMCSGIPVVAHPTPGLRESLGCAGIFADRTDLGAWRRELLALQDPTQWLAASARARRRVAALDPRSDLERFERALLEVVA